ncbi:MAG: hypothetical protein ACQEP1_01345 [Nanobdellota archaeon]
MSLVFCYYFYFFALCIVGIEIIKNFKNDLGIMDMISSLSQLENVLSEQRGLIFEKKPGDYILAYYDGSNDCVNKYLIRDPCLKSSYENKTVDKVRGEIFSGGSIDFIFEPQYFKRAAWRSKQETEMKNLESFSDVYSRWMSKVRGIDLEGYYDPYRGRILLMGIEKGEREMNYILKFDNRWNNTMAPGLIEVSARHSKRAAEINSRIATTDPSIYF